MKAMFDPEGRLDPVSFRDAALILIAVGAVLSLLPLAAPSLTMLSFASFVLIYPWAVIWVKRLHDAGKPGWMFLIPLLLWLAINAAARSIVGRQFALAQDVNPTNLSEALAIATERIQATALPSTIASVIISLVIVFVGNALLKPAPGPNRYDPPSH
jgi:uncharacterized membrane protein YhaH (DUF805 family)